MRGHIQKFKALAEMEYELVVKYEGQLAALNGREEEICRPVSELLHQIEILNLSADCIEKVVSKTKFWNRGGTLAIFYAICVKMNMAKGEEVPMLSF
jgi:hypothetical protein